MTARLAPVAACPVGWSKRHRRPLDIYAAILVVEEGLQFIDQRRGLASEQFGVIGPYTPMG
jgi:hypothetical protein